MTQHLQRPAQTITGARAHLPGLLQRFREKDRTPLVFGCRGARDAAVISYDDYRELVRLGAIDPGGPGRP